MKTTHHRWYEYGTRKTTLKERSYPKVWYWESPERMPISYNYYAQYHNISHERLSENCLEDFKRNAKAISTETYEKHIQVAREEHQQEDYLEYMLGDPWEHLRD